MGAVPDNHAARMAHDAAAPAVANAPPLNAPSLNAPTTNAPVPIGRPAILSLQPGVPRCFGSDDIAETGMLQGWASCERGHAWNDGPDATLLVATRRRPEASELVVAVEPYVTRQNPTQDLTLYANGARAGFWRLSVREVTHLAAWIDPAWWREVGDRAVLRLVFHMPQSVVPHEIGDGDDRRQLGFSFRSLALMAAKSDV